ncbi:MAG: signal peptidase I [Lachnospiraceae bacterium]|nr:signal peptidase I [Lachnospiraceae bacterium]
MTAKKLVITVIIALFIIVVLFFFRINEIEGVSMEPNYKSGDYRVCICLRKAIKYDIKRGEVVLIKDESIGAKEDVIIKRCIASNNDTIRMKDGVLYVNDKAVDEPYIKENMGEHDFISEVKLMDDEIFVMGDNRGESYDSRSFGPVKDDKVISTQAFILEPWKLLLAVVLLIILVVKAGRVGNKQLTDNKEND